MVTHHQLHAINTYRTFVYPANVDWTSTRRRLTHQWCHEEEILITCTHVHNFAKRHWGVGGGEGGGAWCSQNLWKIFLQFEKENPQATTSHQIYEGDNIALTIAIATPLMKRVHEKHSSTLIRHAGEFLHMDHYELTYLFLSHALKNTANQRPGLPLHILRYATGSIPLYFPVITCAQQFTWVHLRTSQKPTPKLFNSCEPLRTFPITSGNFPKISEQFRRPPKIFRKFWKIIKTSENYFWTSSEEFRTLPKISEVCPKILVISNGF